jgi:hypothetical protein
MSDDSFQLLKILLIIFGPILGVSAWILYAEGNPHARGLRRFVTGIKNIVTFALGSAVAMIMFGTAIALLALGLVLFTGPIIVWPLSALALGLFWKVARPLSRHPRDDYGAPDDDGSDG